MVWLLHRVRGAPGCTTSVWHCPPKSTSITQPRQHRTPDNHRTKNEIQERSTELTGGYTHTAISEANRLESCPLRGVYGCFWKSCAKSPQTHHCIWHNSLKSMNLIRTQTFVCSKKFETKCYNILQTTASAHDIRTTTLHLLMLEPTRSHEQKRLATVRCCRQRAWTRCLSIKALSINAVSYATTHTVVALALTRLHITQCGVLMHTAIAIAMDTSAYHTMCCGCL